MKNYIGQIIILAALVVLNAVCAGLANWQAKSYQSLLDHENYNEELNQILSTNNIENLKKETIIVLENKRKNSKDAIESHKDYRDLFLMLMIVSGIALFYLYRDFRKLVSNKSPKNGMSHDGTP